MTCKWEILIDWLQIDYKEETSVSIQTKTLRKYILELFEKKVFFIELGQYIHYSMMDGWIQWCMSTWNSVLYNIYVS